jgi:uncharacterized protein
MLIRFDAAELDPLLSWFCPPAKARVEPGRLVIEPDAPTDFWQRTHYGFRADNGHFLRLQARGNFVLTTRVTTKPRHQYDQAGLMLRVSPDCWLKTSIEHEPQEAFDRLGAVVTNHGYSDWSTQPVGKERSDVWFCLRVEARAVIVEVSFDGQDFQQLRVAHLAERMPETPVEAGLYCCCPQAAGYRAEFHFLQLELD